MQGLSEAMVTGALGGYVAWTAAALGGALWRARALDASETTGEVALPAEPDARRVAYLEEGMPGLIRALALDLCARGFLRLGAQEAAFTEALYVLRDPGGPPPSYLSPHERLVHDAVTESALLDRLEEDGALHAALAPYAQTLHASLAREHLAYGEAQLAARRVAGGVAIALVVAGWVGVFAALGTAAHGALAGALCLGLAAAYWLFGALVWRQAPHATRLGRRWLAAMRQAYRPMLGRAARGGVVQADDAALLMALFGARRFREGLMAPASPAEAARRS